MSAGTPTELREALRLRLADVDRMTAAIKVEGKNVHVPGELRDDYQKAMADCREIKGLLDDATFGTEVKAWLDTPEGASVAMQAQSMGAGGGAQFVGQIKDLGTAFTDSEEFKRMVSSGRATMDMPYSIEGKSLLDAGGYGQKDVYTTMVPPQQTRGFGRTQFDPMVPRAQRTNRVRDLFPVATTNANLIDYFRVVGFGSSRLDLTSAARPVAERTAADGVSAGNAVFGLKPKSSLSFEPAQAPVRTIAHYEVAHRNVLADEPQLQSTINNELLYGLALQEDYQILSGSGTGEDLLGILNTPGIQLYTQANTAGVADEPKSDALRRAATKAILAYYPPTGYVIHPYDWEDIELQKGSGDGQYMLVTNIAVGAQSQVWRQPVVDTPAIPEGTFLTGAWGLGAQLYDRQLANIRIAEQHADFFIRNAVAILAEERLALAVKRPESFVKGTFV